MATNLPLILVVDDDPVMRFMARAALEAADFRIAEASDGEVALQRFRELKPDIVLLDVVMPGLSGYAVCAQIRKLPGGALVPIVMMTGLDDIESINSAYQADATDFITKPINYVLLKHRMRYMLRTKQVQDNLLASEARLANAQRLAKLGNWELDVASMKMKWSHQVLAVLGLTGAAEPQTYQDFLQLVHIGDCDNLDTTVRVSLRNRTSFSLEYRIVNPDGAIRVVYQEAEYQSADGGRGDKLVGTLQDITERKRVEEQMHHLAYYDKVTGLPNRIMLKRQMDQAFLLADKHRQSVALIMVNLDHFQRVNDTLGFSVGDELLRVIAQRLSDCHYADSAGLDESTLWSFPVAENANDLVAHLGADEFVIIVNGLRDPNEASSMACRIGSTIAEPIIVRNSELCVTASMGISVYPDDGSDGEVILKQCGVALNYAKTEGRNAFRFYKPAMDEWAAERLALEADLRKALELQQFRLHYQPKVAARGEQVIGMEALIRWEHPVRGMVPPDRFIRIAEETGLIIPLGDWIMREAAHQVVAWQAEGLPALRISVNLSPIQFMHEGLPRDLAKIIVDTGIDPALLELEITESLLMHDIESTISTLNQLKALGLTISIDDFGIGYSSLNYLKRFPVSTIKIDQSFVRDMTHDADAASIVQAVIALSHSLRLKTVAEGVEEAAQLTMLREFGCDAIQGYFFSRPLPADKFKEWVRSWNRGLLKVQAVG